MELDGRGERARERGRCECENVAERGTEGGRERVPRWLYSFSPVYLPLSLSWLNIFGNFFLADTTSSTTTTTSRRRKRQGSMEGVG